MEVTIWTTSEPQQTGPLVTEKPPGSDTMGIIWNRGKYKELEIGYL